MRHVFLNGRVRGASLLLRSERRSRDPPSLLLCLKCCLCHEAVPDTVAGVWQPPPKGGRKPDSGEPTGPEEFTREILPLIQNIPLRKLQEATGLSLRYVSLIRRGERVPHPLHWTRLKGAFHRS
jgi:hypothetical protein